MESSLGVFSRYCGYARRHARWSWVWTWTTSDPNLEPGEITGRQSIVYFRGRVSEGGIETGLSKIINNYLHDKLHCEGREILTKTTREFKAKMDRVNVAGPDKSVRPCCNRSHWWSAININAYQKIIIMVTCLRKSWNIELNQYSHKMRRWMPRWLWNNREGKWKRTGAATNDDAATIQCRCLHLGYEVRKPIRAHNGAKFINRIF